ncbi:MAG: hypothetical protein Q4Q06_05710, partial [Bacteroidota bacterium]|nr:hypothetical protein [Bacteroidota bacterium]
MIFNEYDKKIMKIKYIFPILTLCLLFFCSCKKEKEQLYGISIDAKKMMKTPAEIFSLQEIQFFQASNDFILSALPHLINEDTVQTDNFVLSPFFLYFTLAQDSTFE